MTSPCTARDFVARSRASPYAHSEKTPLVCKHPIFVFSSFAHGSLPTWTLYHISVLSPSILRRMGRPKAPIRHETGISRYNRSMSVGRQMASRASTAAAFRPYRSKTGLPQCGSPVGITLSDYSTVYGRSATCLARLIATVSAL